MDPNLVDSAALAASAPPSPASGIHLPADPAAASAVVRHIRDEFIRTTPHLEPGCILGIMRHDLVRLFQLYDEQAFHGHLARRFVEQGCGAPQLRFSGRLTAAAGRVLKLTWRDPAAPAAPPRLGYRIEFSTPLVLESFGENAREVHVGGIVCKDRLDVLQRILEHELVHLFEMLEWHRTNCSASNFLWFASRLFGHTVTDHGLVTRRERARAEFGLREGDCVEFEFEGVRRFGQIDRIRRRATGLVEEPCPVDGTPRMRKFYVPLPMLERVEA